MTVRFVTPLVLSAVLVLSVGAAQAQDKAMSAPMTTGTMSDATSASKPMMDKAMADKGMDKDKKAMPMDGKAMDKPMADKAMMDKAGDTKATGKGY